MRRLSNSFSPVCWIALCSLFNISSIAQNKISGIVTEEKGSPLSGVSLTIRNSNFGTTTNENGLFSISVRTNDILSVSMIGFQTQLVKINSGTNYLEIALRASANNLDEMVVTGYTTQRIKEITGSVSIANVRDILATPTGQFEQMLQGRIAGLNVIASGMPGGASNVRLHGIGNFGDVAPLYIIDGVQGNVNNLNPSDIESIQVLKDAGAYAIYGVRGANGVIVITTRHGKMGKTKINYDFYSGVTFAAASRTETLTPQEMADLTWIAYRNSNQLLNGNPNHPLYGNGVNPVLPDYFIGDQNVGLFEGDPRVDPNLYNIDFTIGPLYQIMRVNKNGTDWFRELFKPSFSQNHSLSVSGASEKNKYLFSLGYLNQQGTVLNTFLKRYTTRINTEFSVHEKIRIGENLQLSYRDNPLIETQRGPFTEIFQASILHPIVPVHDIKEGWGHLYPHYFDENPVAMRSLAKDNKSHAWEIFGNAFAEADLLKYFTLRTSFGGNFSNYYSYAYQFDTYRSLPNGLPENSFSEFSGYKRSWTWTNTLKFSKSIRGDHDVHVLVGVEAINNYNRELGGRRIGFFSNDVNYRLLSTGSPQGQSNYSFAGNSTLFSIIGRADYSFRSKYYLTLTIRRDGSSVFGPKRRYGWFPSLSAAWRVKEESLLRNHDWLTDLKLRGSWGKTGFYGNTDPFNQYTTFGGSVGTSYYNINGTGIPLQGFRAVRLGDPVTGWQEDEVTNIGMESLLFNSRVSLSVDLYKKRAKGLLFPVTLPDILGGATHPNTNIGVVQNTGFDVTLGYKRSPGKNWNWDIGLTFTSYRNKITKLGNANFFNPSYVNAAFGAIPYVRNQIGQSIGSFYGFKVIGIFQNEDEVNKAPAQTAARPGRFRYQDVNNDNIISEDDRTFLGNPNPGFTTGINLGIQFKQFSFSFFCYGTFGNKVINTSRMATDFFGDGNSAKSKALLYNSWTPQRRNASIPVIEKDLNYSNADVFNSYLVESGSYLRNKLMTLGYQVSEKSLTKVKVQKLLVYLQGVNMFTLSNYSGLDPELPGQSAAFGIDFGNYPNNQKQFLVGLNITF